MTNAQFKCNKQDRYNCGKKNIKKILSQTSRCQSPVSGPKIIMLFYSITLITLKVKNFYMTGVFFLKSIRKFRKEKFML